MYDAPRLCPPTHKAVGSTVRCPRCASSSRLTLGLEQNLVKMVKRCTNRQISLDVLEEIRHALTVGGFVVFVPFRTQIRGVLDEGHRHAFRCQVVDPILVGFNVGVAKSVQENGQRHDAHR